MKNKSNYFIKTMVLSLIFLCVGMYMFTITPVVSAISFVFSFLCWYAGVMAPNHEKYNEKSVLTVDAIKWWNELTIEERFLLKERLPTLINSKDDLTIQDIESLYQVYLLERL